uniref:Uncharacterized protein n=1 Tax=viral metagenome TaxID=1070528 RepID=A0A6C0AEW6_9ZZZZ
MISIKRLNTNKFSWLQNSHFYKNIDNFDEPVYLEYCSKYTKDIKKYLRVINLWGVTYFPKEFIYLFYKTKPLKEISELFDSTGDPLYDFLIESLFSDDISYWAVKKNQLHFLENLYECGWEIKLNCDVAIDNLVILKFLHKIGCKFDEELLNKSMYQDIEIFKYVHEIFDRKKFESMLIYDPLIPDENQIYIKKHLVPDKFLLCSFDGVSFFYDCSTFKIRMCLIDTAINTSQFI